jgi:SAM-dependent methyltransferase
MNKKEARELVISRGCFSREENERIFRAWFAHEPRYLFRAADRKYGLAGKTLCDAGCSYGGLLLHCGRSAYGIEADADKVRFAESLGLNATRADLVKDDLSSLPKVDIVWCASVLEHVVSPHLCLRNLGALLNPGGLLLVVTPVVPLFDWMVHLPVVGKYASGYDRNDHLYAFIPSTLRYTCERAGYDTMEMTAGYPGPLRVFNRVPGINRLIGRCLYVGRKRIPSS